MEMIIKPLTEEYVDQVCILEEEAFSMPWHRESFLEMILNKDACYLVGIVEDKVVASCGLRNIVGDGEITNVVTAGTMRGRGYGRQMLLKLLEEGSKMGVEATQHFVNTHLSLRCKTKYNTVRLVCRWFRFREQCKSLFLFPHQGALPS